MAIEKIILRNFQIHRKTTLDIHEGINIIAGSSDNGKSSIIRAIRWLCENSPRGFKFRRWNAPEKSITSVVMEVDGSVIERKRGSVSNCYNFDGVTYKALKSDVPEVISELLEISSYNIQRQLEGPFLFSKSSSDVAKMINEVAGISIINDIIKESNRRYREAKNKVSFISDMMKTKKSLMLSHKMFVSLREKASFLEESSNALEDLDYKIATLEKRIAQIREVKKQIKRLKPIEQAAIKSVKKMNRYKRVLDDFDVSDAMGKLNYIILKIRELESVEAIPESTKKKMFKKLSIADKNNSEARFLHKRISAITSLIGSMQGRERFINSQKAKIVVVEMELKEAKEDAGYCPVCGNTFGGKNVG